MYWKSPQNSLRFDFRVLIEAYVYTEKFGQEFRISYTNLSFLGNLQESIDIFAKCIISEAIWYYQVLIQFKVYNGILKNVTCWLIWSAQWTFYHNKVFVLKILSCFYNNSVFLISVSVAFCTFRQGSGISAILVVLCLSNIWMSLALSFVRTFVWAGEILNYFSILIFINSLKWLQFK